MHLMIAAFTLIAAWRWGDWKNWQLYYPTILFMIVGNFLYNVLTYHYPIWMYKDSTFFPNHTTADIFNSFVLFPAVILIFLPHYPKESMIKKVKYLALWITVFVSVEWFLGYLGYFSYYNGWTLGWSFLFNVGMFMILRIHFKRPLLAWAISVFVILFLVIYFDVPIEKMR
jgi:hypothetical protein